ncbi:Hsp70 family protein [Halobacteria archaeon AArc-m2/3/4]|uniref:Hsp70 family protein n=1 Tax=Natronoglomus mannanivorans TaxID=2979990 RepID=A0AAP2Z2L2_9EURY|nr:Hsp70 family protein [Halobacteria archaeon AArc-xg1-1]MCU4974691.1 Hsp70 family protein [Halobacteria archaeon AArc-m2/3/4]
MGDGKRIGIDLGTTYSAAAAVVGDEAEVTPNSEGDYTTPSVASFDEDDGTVIVGREALVRAQTYPDRTVRTIKRHMGDREYTEEIDGEEYTPEQISALLLQKVVSDAEDHLGMDVTNAVITVPAYFGERQRQATKQAGEIAGLTVDRIINEPTAACLAYGLDEEDDDSEIALVYDLGGGTFDVTLVDLAYDIDTVEVVASNGDRQLGGEDWDECLVEWILETFEDDTGIDLSDDPEALGRIYAAAREAKESLSSSSSTRVNIPFLAPNENFEEQLTREEFNDLTSHLVDRTFEVCDELFGQVDYDVGDVETVLLVGGSTRMPLVQERVADYFDQEPSKEIHPDEAVATGAAVQAAIIDRGEGGLGADGQAQELLPGISDGLILVDVTPQSLGVALADGSFDVLIERNESVPATARKESYTTVKDNQTAVKTRVFQGESDVAEENDFLDEFVLEGIAPAPAGEPNLACEFELDENGLLHVEAEDLDRGETSDISIEGIFSRSEAEVEEMRTALPSVE